jgi:hypothetical protein
MVRSTAMRFLVVSGLCAAMAWPAAEANTAQYAGYPSADAPWTKSDYVRFYFTHYNGNRALPHLRSEEGRRLVARLVDRGNVERILETPSGAFEKQQQLSLILTTMGEVRAAYNTSVIVGEPLSEELTRVQVFNLYLLDAASKLAAEPQPLAAWKTTLLGVARSLSEANIYTPAQRAVLAEAIAVHYPALARLLSPRERADLLLQIGALQESAREGAMRRSFARLEAVVGQN